MEDSLLACSDWIAESSVSSRNDDRTHALLLEGEAEVLEHVRSILARESFHVTAFRDVADAHLQLQDGLQPDIALINSTLLSNNGTPALEWFRQAMPAVPAIALSCSYDPRTIVDAVRIGAADVIVPPFERLELSSSLKRCLDSSLRRNTRHVQEIPLTPNTSFVLCSDQMRAIAAKCDLMATTDLPVLILGESGTGKEILAQYIHQKSACSNAPFLKVNCAAMPADLLESELLGYEQGAFTGAMKSKPGKFELCDHGTIFLDEIGEMPPPLQAKLLQVLQDGTFSRLGGRTTIKVDVRVIAATNIDIKAAIENRRFREDLYYRINGFSFHLPSLRKRKEEIPVLIRYFMQRMSEKYARKALSMPPALLNACMQYDWPGNLRELENFIKRYLVLGDDQAMIAELMRDRPLSVTPIRGVDIGASTGGLKKMLSNVKGEAEARAISAALQKNQWKRKKTAAELKISYKALLYKMRQHDIVAPQSGISV
jgi:two-component system, NtrC family, response regulator AtoC